MTTEIPNSPPKRGLLLFDLLRLVRPANVVTSYADILAGYALAGVTEPGKLFLLLASTTGLYGGGIVFNDVFDEKLDAIERAERPIPSGALSLGKASTFGGLLLGCGVLFAWGSSPFSGCLGISIAAAAVFYDAVGKHYPLFGPFNMGLCRGLNLLLGLSATTHLAISKSAMAGVTLSYVAGFTSLSRGEVRGGTRAGTVAATTWLGVSAAILGLVAALQGRRAAFAAPFFILLLLRIAGPLVRAIRTSAPMDIRAAVRAGILSLIVLDCCIAAVFGRPWYGLAILLLYLPAWLFSRVFVVT